MLATRQQHHEDAAVVVVPDAVVAQRRGLERGIGAELLPGAGVQVGVRPQVELVRRTVNLVLPGATPQADVCEAAGEEDVGLATGEVDPVQDVQLVLGTMHPAAEVDHLGGVANCVDSRRLLSVVEVAQTLHLFALRCRRDDVCRAGTVVVDGAGGLGAGEPAAEAGLDVREDEVASGEARSVRGAVFGDGHLVVAGVAVLLAVHDGAVAPERLGAVRGVVLLAVNPPVVVHPSAFRLVVLGGLRVVGDGVVRDFTVEVHDASSRSASQRAGQPVRAAEVEDDLVLPGQVWPGKTLDGSEIVVGCLPELQGVAGSQK